MFSVILRSSRRHAHKVLFLVCNQSLGMRRQCQPPTPARSDNSTNNIFFSVIPPTWLPGHYIQLPSMEFFGAMNVSVCLFDNRIIVFCHSYRFSLTVTRAKWHTFLFFPLYEFILFIYNLTDKAKSYLFILYKENSIKQVMFYLPKHFEIWIHELYQKKEYHWPCKSVLCGAILCLSLEIIALEQ